jgi:transposase
MTIVETTRPVTAGVDTHADVHVAAVVDHLGGVLGVEAFETTEAGCHRLIGWLRSHGKVQLVGVEGTGSYGAGLTRPVGPGRDHGGRSRSPEPSGPGP